MHKHLIVLMLTILSAFLLCSAASAQLTENDIETVQTPEISTNSDAMYKYEDLNTYSSQQLENQYIENSNEQNNLKYSLSSQSNTQTNTLGTKQSTTTASSTSQSSNSNTQTNDPADLDVYKNLDANVDITDLNTRTTNATANYNDIVTWYIWVENKGPDAATNVQVTDLIPNGLVYYGAMDPIVPIGSFNSTTGIWSIDTLNSGDLYELIFWTQVRDVGTLTNVANVTSDIPDPNLSDNTWTVNLNVPVPDQTVDLVVYKDSYDYTTEWNYNEIYSFWIYLGNNGPSDATGVTLTDLLPDGLRLPTAQELLDYYGFSLDPAIVSQGYFDTTTMTWYIGDVAMGDWPTLQLFAKVTGHNTTVTNTANVTSYEYDTNPLDNTASLDITIPPAAYVDLQKEFQDLNGNPIPDINGDTIPDVYFGDYFWSIIKAYNFGPDDISVSIQDDFDMFLTMQFATDNFGENFYVSFNNGTDWIAGSTITNMTFTDSFIYGYFNIDNILKNQSIWIKSYLTTSIYTGLTGNTVQSFLNGGYEWLGPGYANAPLNVLPANLYIEKLIKGTTSTTANYKDTIQYIINIGNTGSPAYNVYVDDFLPMGLEITDFYASIGTFYNTGLWIIDVLNTNQTAQLVFNVTVNATGWLNNTATITSDTPEDNLTDNTATAGLFVPAAADIDVTKDFFYEDLGTISFPDNPLDRYWKFFSEIVVTNNGPDTATNVKITDLLSPGLELAPFDPFGSWFVTYTGQNPDDDPPENNPSFDPLTMIWTIPSMNIGDIWVLDFFTIANTNGTVNNTATFDPTTADQFDWNLTNNVGFVSTYIPTAQTQLSKWFQNDSTYGSSHVNTANYLDNLYAFIKLQNNGPDTAKYITVIDDFPSGLIYDSANMETSYDGGLTWSIDPNAYWLDFVTYFELEWFPSDILSNGMALFRIPVQVNSSNTIIVNNATETQRTFNPNGDNTNEPGFNTINTTTSLNIPQASVIQINKEFWNYGDFGPGSPITTANYYDWVYAVIKVANNGPDDAYISIQDILSPAFITDGWVAVSTDGLVSYVWEYLYDNPDTGIFSYLIPAGSEYWFAIESTVNSTGNITNTVTQTAQDTYNPDYPNGGPYSSAQAILEVPQAAIVDYTKEFRTDYTDPTSGTNTANYHDWIYAIISAVNQGPDTVNVQIQDIPSGFSPNGVYYVNYGTGWIPADGSYSGGVWNITMPALANYLLAIYGQVTATGTVNNTAEEISQDIYNPYYGPWPDLWYQFHSPYYQTTAQLNVPPASVIDLSKEFRETVNGTAINIGHISDSVWGVITTTNNGPDAANVTYHDTSNGFITNGTYKVSHDGGITWLDADGSYNATTGIWSINLPAGATYLLALLGQLSITGLVNNTITEATQNTYNPDVYPSATAIIDVKPIPIVTSVVPANNATNVSKDQVITVTFNVPIKAGSNWIELKTGNGSIVPIKISINGNVLTITPVNSLTENRYILELHTGSLTDLYGYPIALFTSRFSVGTSPTVTSVNPANNATNVPSNKVITVTFDEKVKAGSNWIELKTGNGAIIAITTSILNNVLTITPVNPLTENRYILELHTGSLTDLAGNPLALFTSRFSVGTSPTVTSVNPANNATNVPKNQTITVTFNEKVKAGSNWIELKTDNGSIIPINISINGNVLTITPVNPLTENRYTLILHTGSLTDLAGNPLALFSSKFSVGSSPIVTSVNPANNTMNVPRNQTITVTFNEKIKAATNWIELKTDTGKLVSFVTKITNNILTITPTAQLASNTRYTLILHTGSLTDLAGNPIALWTSRFTTRP